MKRLLAGAACVPVAGCLLVIGSNDATHPFGRTSLNPFDDIKVERYDSRSEASEKWTGVVEAPAWLPGDASKIVRTASTEDQVELVVLTSSEEVRASDCTALRAPTEPSLTTIDVPALPAQVYDCGGWHVFDESEKWYGWQDSETLDRAPVSEPRRQ